MARLSVITPGERVVEMNLLCIQNVSNGAMELQKGFSKKKVKTHGDMRNLHWQGGLNGDFGRIVTLLNLGGVRVERSQ